jgi:N-acetyl-D-muramate 6-phosphate phosphatase
MKDIRSVLFDLDGTLLDTAPDLVFTINRLREEHGLPALPLSTIRPIVSLGSKAMVKLALGIEENHPTFSELREYFLALYQDHLAMSTQFFPQVEKVLAHLDAHNIPWGIVTNKLTRHTTILLKALNLDHRPACIICGDSLPTYKPDPAPILHACELVKQEPKHCLYVGDCITDVMASKAAGTKSLVALYGYIGEEEDPYTWKADGYIQEPLDILTWLDHRFTP